MKIHALLILAGGKQKAIALPEGSDLASLIVKVKTDEGLVSLGVQGEKIGLRSIVASSVVASEKKKETARENLKRAAVGRVEAKTRSNETIEGFLAKLSPPQRLYAERLFVVLELRDGDLASYRATALKWLTGILECCPEPWRLDFGFLRKWLSNPYSAANRVPTGEETAGSVIHMRRAVARKEFIKAWEEQIGAVAAPPDIPALRKVRGVVSEQGNHPFTVLYHALQRGEITRIEDLRAQIREYADAKAVMPSEVDEAERMIASGKWMGEVAVPGV